MRILRVAEEVDPHWNDPPAKTPEQELAEMGGSLAVLMSMAKAIRAVASEVEGLAWALDRERRGALSVGARQDHVEVGNTVLDLLDSPLLSVKDRTAVAARVLEHLQPKPPEPAQAPAASPAPAAATGGLVVETSNVDIVALRGTPAKRKVRKARRARR